MHYISTANIKCLELRQGLPQHVDLCLQALVAPSLRHISTVRDGLLVWHSNTCRSWCACMNSNVWQLVLLRHNSVHVNCQRESAMLPNMHLANNADSVCIHCCGMYLTGRISAAVRRLSSLRNLRRELSKTSQGFVADGLYSCSLRWSCLSEWTSSATIGSGTRHLQLLLDRCSPLRGAAGIRYSWWRDIRMLEDLVALSQPLNLQAL